MNDEAFNLIKGSLSQSMFDVPCFYRGELVVDINDAVHPETGETWVELLDNPLPF